MPWKIIVCNPANTSFFFFFFCNGEARWAYGEKNRPDNVKHVVECLKWFMIVARHEPPGMDDETEEQEEEVTSVDACECRKFESTPHQMFGRCY
ncbi:hypothetical protein NPIL_361491 [Nephila pilipes]|uniref:Uncharacterized protein n=1 Tax=Nephila pilipes TaxID=299642 RepID=A0A8X6UA13_NEPPI|nr:hypothetical protein NPIL_361491 [Nephila pilipes]